MMTKFLIVYLNNGEIIPIEYLMESGISTMQSTGSLEAKKELYSSIARLLKFQLCGMQEEINDTKQTTVIE
jgi:hypothetical protein